MFKKLLKLWFNINKFHIHSTRKKVFISYECKYINKKKKKNTVSLVSKLVFDGLKITG